MSVYFDILSAVKAQVAAVVPNTKLYKKAIKLEADTLPVCLVCPGEGGEQIVQQTFNKGVWYAYPVFVAYVTAGNRQVGEVALGDFLGVREQVRNALYVMPAAAQSFDLEMSPREAVEYQAFLGSNYDVTGWLVKYKVAESRTS